MERMGTSSRPFPRPHRCLRLHSCLEIPLSRHFLVNFILELGGFVDLGDGNLLHCGLVPVPKLPGFPVLPLLPKDRPDDAQPDDRADDDKGCDCQNQVRLKYCIVMPPVPRLVENRGLAW